MQLNSKEQLIHSYKNLPPKIKKYVKIQNQCIREKDQNGQLQKIFMAYAVFISSLAVQYNYPYIIMITASHNPPNYNGIKMQSLDPSQIVNVQEIQSIINDQNKLLLYLQRLQLQPSTKIIDFFIGRDMRPSSSRLSQILIDTLQKMGSKVVNLGQGSTPEIFSLSTYLSQKITLNDPQVIQSLSFQYFEEIKLTLQRAVYLISSITGKSWQKKRIFIDFANGVGAVSFQKYEFLRQFFQFTITHYQNFGQPNVQCGAQWIYHHRLNPSTFSNLPQADFYVWFDGDSDRLIMKSGKQMQLIQGEDFNACFSIWIKTLISDLECSLRIGSVQSILTNYGSIKFLQNLKIQQKYSAVGISNLYKFAQTFDVCSFFQPNGHGCIYFSKHAIETFEKLKIKYWQAQLLLLINNITKNNSRGYALHIFLVIMLYFHHNQTENAFLFQKTYSIENTYHLNKPQLFVNSSDGERLLIQPLGLVQDFLQISKKYSDLLMKLRKSQTSPALRITIQGEQKTCKQCEAVFQQIVKKYI